MHFRPLILLVDDEQYYREPAAKALMNAGCDVIQAEDPVEALEKIAARQGGRKIDALVTDGSMRLPQQYSEMRDSLAAIQDEMYFTGGLAYAGAALIKHIKAGHAKAVDPQIPMILYTSGVERADEAEKVAKFAEDMHIKAMPKIPDKLIEELTHIGVVSSEHQVMGR